MSDGESQALNLVYLVGVLVLVVSALAVRRVPMRQGLKMALAWLFIFAAAFAVVALKDDFLSLFQRLGAEASGETGSVSDGETLRIRLSEDGHFWVDARLNGVPVRFLVDSGATISTVSAETARAAGLERRGSYPVLVNTANGTAAAWRSRAKTLVVGPIVRNDVPLHIAERIDLNLLGMNFLSSLSAWRVEGQWLILEP